MFDTFMVCYNAHLLFKVCMSIGFTFYFILNKVYALFFSFSVFGYLEKYPSGLILPTLPVLNTPICERIN